MVYFNIILIGISLCAIAGGYFLFLPYDRKPYIESLKNPSPEEEKTYTTSQVFQKFNLDENIK